MSEAIGFRDIEPEYNDDPEWKKDLFIVDNDQKAEWCLQQIKKAKADKAFWKDFYEQRQKEVEETADLTIANMEAMLKSYFDGIPHSKTDTQENYKLPSGKLVLKKQEPEFVRDNDKMIQWCKKSGHVNFVKVKETVDWDGLKKSGTAVMDDGRVVDANGEVIDGVTAVFRPDIFKAEVKAK